MNKKHRSLWNGALGAWVAVSEITRARGKRSAGGEVASSAKGSLASGFTVGCHYELRPAWLLASASLLGVAMFGSPAWAQRIVSKKLVLTPSHERHHWVLEEDLHIGNAKEGTLSLTQGSTVSNLKGAIAFKKGSTGEVSVTDLYSTWINRSGLVIPP